MKKIEKITISNFRNIKHAEYILGDKTAICGKNHIGKTNALQAAYWVLTDSMLENTNDFDSIVPHDDNRALTEVTITFEDGTTFGKTYREKWTKTRGSDIETLTGHETNFYTNGVPLKTKTEATSIIRSILFEDKDNLPLKYSTINLAKALVNPLYLFGQEEWKLARQFIISLVGDIKDDDIFEAHPEFRAIEEDLLRMNGKVDMLSKNYNDKSKLYKNELTKTDTTIDFTMKKMQLNEVKDDELKGAKKVLEDYEEGLKQAKETSKGAENPLITSKKNEIQATMDQIQALQQEIALDENKHFEEYTIERQQAMNEWAKQANKAEELQTQINKLSSGKASVEARINDLNQELELAKDKKQRLYEQYKEIKAREFHFTETKCPNCGAILNADEEEKAREAFENRKNGDSVDCIARGKATATDISRIEAELEAQRRKLAESSDSAIAQLQNELSGTCQKRELKKQILDSIKPYRSPKHADLDQLKQDKMKQESELRQLQAMDNVDAGAIVNQFIASKSKAKEQAQEVIDKKAVYESARGDLENLKCEKTIINHNLTVLDEKKEILKQFVVTKLHMINASTAKAFPDIEFTLIEPNIKEGSFNEVCYPLIKGKKTPFINGSNSERIMTGIAIINDIERFLDLAPLCIVFDEGETLDSETIGAINTQAQIVTSVVDDRYDIPTAVLIR